ncbi:MAG: response regulator [Verrucomicrobiales bacterium]|nr:response regulator [Verrucomicrobiales bacterium]
MLSRSKKILYAEDDPNDVVIFNMVLKRATLPHQLYSVEDGEAAIEWLQGIGKFHDRDKFPMADVLIVDLKMPRKSGFDVLQWVRANPDLAALPVIVLSSSDDPGDVKRAHALGATTYFVKSASFQELIQYLRTSV